MQRQVHAPGLALSEITMPRPLRPYAHYTCTSRSVQLMYVRSMCGAGWRYSRQPLSLLGRGRGNEELQLVLAPFTKVSNKNSCSTAISQHCRICGRSTGG